MKKFLKNCLYFIMALLIIAAIGFGIYIVVRIAWQLIKLYFLIVLVIIIFLVAIFNS